MHAGENVCVGRDHTLYAVKEGEVVFKYDPYKKKQVVHVVEEDVNVEGLKSLVSLAIQGSSTQAKQN